MPVLDMRNEAVYARHDLAYAMRNRGLPVELIQLECGFKSLASAYRAIRSGKERASQNEGRVSNRMFGIELEFNGTDRESVVRELRTVRPDFPVNIEGYNHQQRPHWKLITDSSVNGTGVSGAACECDPDDDDCECDQYESDEDGQGLEAVSPILQGSDGYDQVKTMVAAMRAAGGAIDRSCGFHVHHDVRDMNADQVTYLLSFYMDNQKVIDTMLAPSRRTNHHNQWCGGHSDHERETVKRLAKAGNGFNEYYERYRTINVQSFARYGSIEIRQHQGTLNYQKIVNWVKFGQAIVEAAIKHGHEEAPTFTELTPMLEFLVAEGGMPKSVSAFLQARAASYND